MHLAFLGNAANYHVQKWLPALVKQGAEISLITLEGESPEIEGVKTHRLSQKAARFIGKTSQLDFFLATKELVGLLDEIKPDIMLASYVTSYGILAARCEFEPLAIQTWTFDLTKYPQEGFKGWLYKSKVEDAFSRASLIITDGKALAKEGQKLYPEFEAKFSPITWGIKLSDFQGDFDEKAVRERLGIPADAPVVTNGRGVHEWYRPEITLAAISNLLDNRSEAWAIVLTLNQKRDTPVQKNLELLVEHPRCLVFDEMLPRDQLRDILLVTDLLLSIPPRDGVSELLIESLYMGCIPVVSKIPSNEAILVDRQSAVFIEGDEDLLDDVFNTLDSSIDELASLKEKMIGPNRKWVEEEASVDTSAARLYKLLSDVLKSYHP